MKLNHAGKGLQDEYFRLRRAFLQLGAFASLGITSPDLLCPKLQAMSPPFLDRRAGNGHF